MSLHESVQKLSRLSARINDYTDRLNAAIDRIEAELAEVECGFPVWLDDEVPLPKGASLRSGDTSFKVGWTKVDGWGLHFQTPSGAAGEEAPMKLSDGPRSVRVAAFPHLPELVALLVRVAEENLREFEPIVDDLPERQSLDADWVRI